MADRSAAGSLAGSLAGAAAGSLAGGGGSEPSLAALGADLLHHWEVPDASSPLITLNGGNISQLNDRGPSGKHLTQATAGNQPLFEATGGPNSQPCCSLQSTARRLVQAAMGIATGKRLGIYWLAKAPGDASFSVQGQVLNGGGGQPGTIYQNASKFVHFGPSSISITTPALSSAWAKRYIEYLATGSESRIDGALTTPNFTGSATCAAIDSVEWGHSSAAGGKDAFLCIVDNIDAAKRSIVDAYLLARYGL